GGAVRLLLQRDDREGRGALVEDSKTRRGADSKGDERASVPLWNVSEHHSSDPARVRDHGVRGGAAMSALPRREFIKAGGALVIGFGLRDQLSAQATSGLQARGAVAGPPDAKQIGTGRASPADKTANGRLGVGEP